MIGIKNALMGIYMMLAVLLVSIKGRPTRGFSSGAKTLVLAAVVLLVAAGGASAFCTGVSGTCDGCCFTDGGGTRHCYQCGDTVMNSCTFNVPMNCPAGSLGLKIGTNGIVIDGDDYTLTGTMSTGETCNGGEEDPCTYTGIVNDGYNNAVVKDLEITGFCTGVSIGRHTQAPTNMSVIGCEIHDCGAGAPSDVTVGHGIHLSTADHITISNNTIYNIDGDMSGGCGAGGNGIFVYSGNGHNTITHNDIYDNHKSGIFTKQRSQYNHIAHNNITGPRHEEGGISLMCMGSSYNLVEWNNVSGNNGWGIEMGGFWNNVSTNTINDNGEMGVSIDRCRSSGGGSYDNRIFNNSICRNGFDAPDDQYDYGAGVWIVPWCYNSPFNTTLYNNTICDNRDSDLANGDLNATGDWNMGDTVSDGSSVGFQPYYDFHPAPGHNFTWHCPGSGPDLVIRNLNPHWVNSNSYNVSFEVYNQGTAALKSNASVKIVNRSNVVVKVSVYPIGALLKENGSTIMIGPFDFTNAHAPHNISVCADIYDAVDEYGFGNEDNNCSTDVFGAPDLIINGPEADWVDPSMKQVNLTYTVRNVGDNISGSFSVCVMQSPDGPWGPCCEVVQGPLNVGDSYTGTIGPITADTGYEKVRVYADYYNVIIENDERCEPASCGTDNCDYRTLAYPGPCLGCGDVDCTGAVNAGDIGALNQHVYNSPYGLDCKWAGDVDSSGAVNAGDIGAVNQHVYNSPYGLTCCGGECPP